MKADEDGYFPRKIPIYNNFIINDYLLLLPVEPRGSTGDLYDITYIVKVIWESTLYLPILS